MTKTLVKSMFQAKQRPPGGFEEAVAENDTKWNAFLVVKTLLGARDVP